MCFLGSKQSKQKKAYLSYWQSEHMYTCIMIKNTFGFFCSEGTFGCFCFKGIKILNKEDNNGFLTDVYSLLSGLGQWEVEISCKELYPLFFGERNINGNTILALRLRMIFFPVRHHSSFCKNYLYISLISQYQ